MLDGLSRGRVPNERRVFDFISPFLSRIYVFGMTGKHTLLRRRYERAGWDETVR